MLVPSKSQVEQKAWFNASIYELVQKIGRSNTVEEACDEIAKFVGEQNATLLTISISDWSSLKPVTRPFSNIGENIKTVVNQLQNFGGSPIARESRVRLSSYAYNSIDRSKYTSLLERRFFQEVDRLGYVDFAILPVIAGKGVVTATVALDREFDEKLRAYVSGATQHVASAFLANFPQIARAFEGRILSNVEAGVLTRFCKGMSAEQISTELDMSPHAIQLVWESAQSKLNAKNRYETIHRAITIGELDLPQSFDNWLR